MLGTPASGKTTFLLGMYMTLHAGVHGYTMITTERNRHLDLRDEWQAFKNQGVLPSLTGTDPIQYDFIFRQRLNSLMHLDVLDFRGRAIRSQANSAATDAARIRERLPTS